MELNSDIQHYLLKIINTGLFSKDPMEAVRLTQMQKVCDENIPHRIEALLSNFCNDPRAETLTELSLFLVTKFYLCSEYQLAVVSRLVANKQITHQKAFDLLSLDKLGLENLPAPYQNCIDAIWLLKEDEKDGFMSIDEDSLFIDSLLEISKSELIIPSS